MLIQSLSVSEFVGAGRQEQARTWRRRTLGRTLISYGG